MMFLLVVTLTSMLLAAIMSAIAWRMAGDQRRRSEARVAALAAEIHDAGAPPPSVMDRFREEPVDTNVFNRERPPSGSRAAIVVGGGAVVFGAAVALAILAGSAAPRARRSASPPNAAAAAAPSPVPLELLALGHERVGDQLTVRGVIRNPVSGVGMDRVTAVVFLFTPDGGFLESGRADIAATELRPGGESTFVVTVPRAADVARYRVSFRTDQRVVPHLDRRHEG
jgi:hypothetical protein